MTLYLNQHEHSYQKMIYSGGEVSIRLEEMYWPLTNAEIKLNLFSSSDVFELLMLTDAVRRINPNVKVDVHIPYFPYARQDRVCNPGEALSIKVMTNLINAQNYNSVTIWDAHSDVTPALLNNCVNKHCFNWVREIPSVNYNKFLVAPDAGAAKKIKVCSESLEIPYLTATKVRNSLTGDIADSHIETNYIGGNVLVVDDICDGGRTFIDLAKKLKPHMGPNSKLTLYITHGIFSRGTEELKKWYNKIYCANPWLSVENDDFVEKV